MNFKHSRNKKWQLYAATTPEAASLSNNESCQVLAGNLGEGVPRTSSVPQHLSHLSHVSAKLKLPSQAEATLEAMRVSGCSAPKAALRALTTNKFSNLQYQSDPRLIPSHPMLCKEPPGFASSAARFWKPPTLGTSAVVRQVRETPERAETCSSTNAPKACSV